MGKNTPNTNGKSNYWTSYEKSSEDKAHKDTTLSDVPAYGKVL